MNAMDRLILDAYGYSLYSQRQGCPADLTKFQIDLYRSRSCSHYFDGTCIKPVPKKDDKLDDDFFKVELPKLNQEN
jgi:hypothetical protein